MTELKIQHNTPKWYAFRKGKIGGSDAGAVLGLSGYKSNLKLWKEKTGLIIPPEIDNPQVQYGKAAEEPLARLFALDFPEYDFHFVKDTVYLHDNGYSFASLDGKLIEKSTGRIGGYEGKTAEIYSKKAELEWTGRVPDNYFTQVIHCFYVTGWEFWVINVQFKKYEQGVLIKTTRPIMLERRDYENDIAVLAKKEKEFYGYIERKEQPPLILPNF